MAQEKRKGKEGKGMTRIRKMKIDKILLKKPGKFNPVFVSFQNGALSSKALNNAKLKLKNTPNGNATTVQIKTKNGHIFKPSNNPGTLKRKWLLIKNKKTKKAKLVEVDYELLINSVVAKKPDEVVVVPQTKGIETVTTLQKAFGGKKAVRKLDQMEKLNVNPNFVQNELESAIKDIDTSQQINQSDLIDDSLQQILPPCNRFASSPDKVYDLGELIGDEELASMADEAQKTIEDDSYTNLCSEFFKDCLLNAKGVKSENLNQQVAGILYCELLIEFLNVQVRKCNSSNYRVCNFSPMVHDKIINEFCVMTESGINRPKSMRDKAICYIMAISTACSNFKINLKLLSEATSCSVKRLGELARHCGLTQTPSNLLLLKLPLPALPKPPKKPPGKKR